MIHLLIAVSAVPDGYYCPYPDFLELTFSMTSVTSTALQLKFVFVTFAFRSIVCPTSLKKMTSELTYGTLSFMNIY